MPVDLSAYFERIGATEPRSVDLSALEDLHRAHLAAIPFENIDVRLGREIRLDLDSLAEKLVARRRGGYCFEHNTLFAAVLRQLGFDVSTLEARVRPPGATVTLPRTHMVLELGLGDHRWLVDVGFGGDGPLLPVPMDGEPSRQPDGDYRVVREADDLKVLRRRAADAWVDLYAFSTRPALSVDFEVANHYTATHPRSVFRRTLTVQRSLPDERHVLRGRDYELRRGGETIRRELAREELGPLLVDTFGLDLSDDEIAALEALE